MYTIYMLLFQVKDHDLMWFGQKKSIFFESFFPIWISAQKACAQDLQPSSSQPIHWYLSFSIRVLPHGELNNTEHPAHIFLFFIVLFGQAFMSDLSISSDVLTNVFNFSFKSFFRMYFVPVFTVLVDFLVDFVFDFDDDVGKFFILFTVGGDVVIDETADDVFGTCVWKSIVGDGFCFPDGSFDNGFLMLVFSEEVVTVDAPGNEAAPDEDDSR